MSKKESVSFCSAKCSLIVFWVVLAAIPFAVISTSASVIFQGSVLGNDPGEIDAASAEFDITVSGTTTNLTVKLTNDATYDPNDPGDILTAVFFTLTGNPTLAAVSAVLAPGSAVKGNGGLTDPGGVVGGEWAYASSVNTNGANQGTSSAGLGIFGPANLFPGSNLEGPVSPDGVQYGISTAFDAPGNDNGGIAGVGLITNAVVFTLGQWPASLNLADISNVSFQYGTALSEPNVPGVLIPEPSTGMLAMAGICLLGLLNRKRR
jgi:hypothetical protein